MNSLERHRVCRTRQRQRRWRRDQAHQQCGEAVTFPWGTDVTGIPSGKVPSSSIDVNCDTGVIAAVGKTGVFLSQDLPAAQHGSTSTSPVGAGTSPRSPFRRLVQLRSLIRRSSSRCARAGGYHLPIGERWHGLDHGQRPYEPNRWWTQLHERGNKCARIPGNHAGIGGWWRGDRRAGLTAAAAPSVTANSLDSDASLAGSGSGTATLRSLGNRRKFRRYSRWRWRDRNRRRIDSPGDTGQASQSVAVSNSLKIKKGKPKALPGTTNRGLAVTWKSSKPKVCKVKGAKVTGAKKGSCVLTATAPGSATVNPLTQTVSVKVS